MNSSDVLAVVVEAAQKVPVEVGRHGDTRCAARVAKVTDGASGLALTV